MGNVGSDLLGDHLLDELDRARVETVVTRGGRTGSIIALIDTDGERSFLTDRGASDDLTQTPIGALDQAAVVHVPLYSLLNEPLRSTTLALLLDAKLRDLIVSLDASSTGAIEDHGVAAAIATITGIGPDIMFCNTPESLCLERQR